MDVLVGHAPFFERRNQRLHHWARAANVEIVNLKRQGLAQQLNGYIARVLKIDALFIFRQRVRVTDMQAEIGVHTGQGLEVRLHGVIGGISHAVEQPDFSVALMLQGGVEHGQHGRDADAAGDQHDRVGAALQEEVSAGRLDVQHVAFVHMVVEVVRRQAGWCCGVSGRGQCSLDRYPVMRVSRCIRKRIATHDVFRRTAGRVAHGQLKGKKLPRLIIGQGAAVGGDKIERTHQLGRVLECLAGDLEGSRAFPQRRFAGQCVGQQFFDFLDEGLGGRFDVQSVHARLQRAIAAQMARGGNQRKQRNLNEGPQQDV